MPEVDRLAAFASGATYDALPAEVVAALSLHVLDAIACALGALGKGPTIAVRRFTDLLGGAPSCALVGGGRTAPDRAAFYNGALVRYLDFNDAFLAPGETCHPSDSFAAVLAACETAGTGGKDLLAALAVAYQVQCRLSEAAPVRRRGFDHTVQLAYGAAAGCARALRLTPAQTAAAVSIAGTALNALRVTRTGRLSHWKGLAAPHAAAGALAAALLAREGITGPAELFEGNKGFREALAGPFSIEWEKEGLSAVLATSLKRYDAEIHSQSCIEALLWLRAERSLRAEDLDAIEVDVFDVAFQIIGGGEEGEKTHVRTREDADHSLPYLLAVALLDGRVGPQQFAPARIAAADVQTLLSKIRIRPDAALSRRFPAEMPCRLIAVLADGQRLVREQADYEGFRSRPMGWDAVVGKLRRLAGIALDERDLDRLVRLVERLPQANPAELSGLLARAKTQE